MLLALPWWKPAPIPLFLGLEVRWFGILVLVALLVGSAVALLRARAVGIEPRIVGELVAFMMGFGVFFGHVLDALFYHWDAVVVRPLLVLDLSAGLSSFGGFAGAALGGYVWARWRKLPLAPFADVVAFAFPFGWIFGRFGCFLAHDHPGLATDFPLAMADYRILNGAPPWLVRHDLGLYESAVSVVIALAFLILALEPRARGVYLAWLAIAYAPARFVLDFLRATDIPGADPRWLGLTPGHYAAVILFGLGVRWLIRIRRGPSIEIPEEAKLPS